MKGRTAARPRPVHGWDARGRKSFIILIAFWVVSGLLVAGSGLSRAQEETARRSWAGTVPALDFPEGLEWLNVERPLTWADLAGKAVLLDFWTYGCINCLHNLPGLLRLQEEFKDELVIIGVHSAKFPNESVTANIRQISMRYGLDYPIVNDRDFQLFFMWGARAWPTLVLIDPAGKVVGGHTGEGVYEVFQPVLTELVAEFDELGLVDRRPLSLLRGRGSRPATELAYPGKVLADPERRRLFVADTHHHRIVVAHLDSGEIQEMIGRGEPGFADGTFATASFTRPQGMALSEDGSILYVADSGNHSVRRVYLTEGRVDTLVGTGEQAWDYPPRGGLAPHVALSSPWDLERVGDRLYVAMAGSHQLWVIHLEEGTVRAWAGSGLEGTFDGPRQFATLAQPMGLTFDPERDRIYFVDTEGSSVRWTSVDETRPLVLTLAGSGASLFDFGDVDGRGKEARFQHPRGITYYEGKLYVADTYNGKIKEVDPETGEVRTLFGAGQGFRDGEQPLFYEPGGIHAVAGKLYVADTNNHVVRVVDLASGVTETLVLSGAGLRAAQREAVPFTGRLQRLGPVTVGAGPGEIHLAVAFPAGYALNPLAPSAVSWRAEGGIVAPVGWDAGAAPGEEREGTARPLEESGDRGVLKVEALPLAWPVTFIPGEGTVYADLDLLYCEAHQPQLCFIEQVRLEVPLTVVAEGPRRLSLSHAVVLPEEMLPSW